MEKTRIGKVSRHKKSDRNTETLELYRDLTRIRDNRIHDILFPLPIDDIITQIRSEILWERTE